MRVFLAAFSKRLIMLFGLLFIPNMIAYGQEVIQIEGSALEDSGDIFNDPGSPVDMYFRTYFAIGPEFILGGQNDVELAPSVYAELKSTFRLRNYKNWIVNTALSVSDDDSRIPLNGDFNNFGNLQLEIDALNLEYRCDCGALYAGIFAPRFGVPGRYQGIGLLGDDLIDYDLVDKIGFGGDYVFSNGPGGKHTVSGSVFDDFRSFAVAVDGTLPQVGQSFRYHLGASSEAQDGGSSEGYVAGIGQTGYALTQDVQLQWLGELAHITNFKNSGEDFTFFTLGGVLNWENYTASATYAFDTDNVGEFDNIDNLFAVSAGYKLGGYGTLSVAYSYRDINENPENKITLIYSNYRSFGRQF